MFVKAIRIATRAMFPIFRQERIDPQQFRLLVVGAGFFVNRQGYFVTVSHVFDNSNAQTTFLYTGQLPDNLVSPPLTITEIARNDDFDVFIGRIDIRNRYYFWFLQNRPEIGRSVCLSGYPLVNIGVNPQGGPDVGGVRRYFQPSFVLDYTVLNCDNGFGRIRRHDGFLARDLGLFGMSGGPVFDIQGRVVGMQGSITQPRVSSGGGGRSISVENAVIIRTELILDLLRRNHIRYNFLGYF